MNTLLGSPEPEPEFDYGMVAASYRENYRTQMAGVSAALRATVAVPVRLPQKIVGFLR